jgi:hypothetical protein
MMWPSQQEHSGRWSPVAASSVGLAANSGAGPASSSRAHSSFIRTLKEQLLWVRTSHTLEEFQDALRAFRIWYNTN